MRFLKPHLSKTLSWARRKQFALFLAIPGLFYLSADFGSHDAAASAYLSLDMIVINDGAGAIVTASQESEASPVSKTADLAWLPASLANFSESHMGFSFQEEAGLAEPPFTKQSSLRMIKAMLDFPDFRPDERRKLFEQLKVYSIHNEADLKKAQHCLAEAIYFESAHEPERGQRAVAQVVLNRVKSGIYPSTVCGVIYQNIHRRNSCQFSYACDGKSERITDNTKWRRAKKYAEDAIASRVYLKEIGNATHYHANYVSPDWRFEMKRLKQIGLHIFYSMRTRRNA